MQSMVIPGNHTSSVRITVGQAFDELTLNGTDPDAIGIFLEGGKSYRITLDPAFAGAGYNPFAPPNKDPLIGDILTSTGTSLGLSDDDSGSGTAATLIFTPSVDDTYFIVVTPQGPSDVGGWWTLTVNDFVAPSDDFGTNLDPSNPISIGQTQDAHIGTAGDTDTIALSLTAGVAVDITLYGNDVGFFGELADAEIISFVDSGGVAVDPADYDTAQAIGTFTSGINVDAHQITYTPTTTGIFYLTVGGAGSEIGDYSVSISGKDKGIFSVRANEEFTATGNDEIDMFFIGGIGDVNPEHVFTDRDGDGVTTLTYSVPGANPGFSPSIHNVIASEWTNGYAPADGVVLDAYFAAIDAIETFAKVDFVQVPDTGVEAGTFRIGTTGVVLGSASGALVTGWSGFPEWTMAGETWINTTLGAQNIGIIQSFGAAAATEENFLLNRTLHEFTHNFGLNHPDQSSLASGVDPSLLGQEYSVMSRTSSGLFPNAIVGDLFPQTLMWLDIQALQAAHGVNDTATAGDDVFTFAASQRHFKTIWDYAGTDTLVLAGAANRTIDLTPGTWQNVGTSINYYDNNGALTAVNTNTVFIAPDTVIENVTAGGGNDHLTGNDADNSILGGAGSDTLNGVSGNDTLSGGGDGDHINGGDGDDEMFGGDAGDTLLGGIQADTLAGGGGNDSIAAQNGDDVGFGGDGRDTMIAGAGRDSMTGNAGNDEIFGGSGIDTLLGGENADTIAGNDNGDIISGNQGADRLFGGAGNDTLDGGDYTDFVTGFTGNDLVTGALGDDTVYGGDGDDTVLGGDGQDFLAGNEGNDELFGGVGNDTIDAGFDDDLVAGDAGNDSVSGNTGADTVFGGEGADTVIGGDGDDELFGNAGDDQMFGGAGADTMNGGDGSDLMTGNGGDDVLLGGQGDDTLIGAEGAEDLQGGDGADSLVGNQGNDSLTGGQGNDTLVGGNDDDRFIFSGTTDIDEISGFVTGAGSADVIVLSGYGAAFDDFTDVQAAASDDGTDTTIDLGGGSSVIILGVVVADLHQDDFIFT